MIHVETITLKEHVDYDEMKTEVQIEGTSEIIKEELKTLLIQCKKDKHLLPVVIMALREVLYDN